MAIKTQDILEALDGLVESHFRDNLASSIVQTNNNLFISIWKSPQVQTKPGAREINMKYLPLFYVIGSVEDTKLCLKLITYHGKVIDEVNEKDFPLDDGNKLGFIGKLDDVKLCRGICFDTQNVNWSIHSNVLLECLENNLVLRSRQCQFGVFEDEALVCDHCESLNIEDLKENIFHAENLEETMISKVEETDEILDEPYGDGYLPSIPETQKKKRGVKRKGVKRKAKKSLSNVINCAHCGFEADTKDSLTEHIIADHVKVNETQNTKVVHNMELDKNKKEAFNGVEYTCEICNFVTTKKDELRQHIDSNHGSKDKLNCNECTFSTKKRKRGAAKLTEHLENAHQKVLPFQCEQCEYKFAYKRELEKHVSAVHMKIKPFLCNFCSYETAYKSQLSWHINIVHNKVKPFLCEYCPYKTSQKRNLTLHNRCKHEMVKPIKCTYEDCNYETISTSRLTTHIKFVHQKIKPFVCQLCPFATDTNYHLQNHINVSKLIFLDILSNLTLFI